MYGLTSPCRGAKYFKYYDFEVDSATVLQENSIGTNAAFYRNFQVCPRLQKQSHVCSELRRLGITLAVFFDHGFHLPKGSYVLPVWVYCG